MKPFRAIHQRRSVCGDPQLEPEEVLIVEILPATSEDRGPEVIFVRPDGYLDSDWLGRFYNCRIPWPEG